VEASKSDILSWLKSVDANFKWQLKHFLWFALKFRKTDSNLIQLEVDGTLLSKFYDVAENFLSTLIL
jgi:hypothetical protein